MFTAAKIWTVSLIRLKCARKGLWSDSSALETASDKTQVRSKRPPLCARSLFVRSFSRSFVFVLLSLAFGSFAFTLVRFGYAHFAVARFSLVRFHAPSLVLPSLCPLCCAFRCSFICLFVSFFSAITPRPCLWPLRAAQLPPALSVPPLLCI